MSRFGVVVFPGSNCERDLVQALSLLGHNAVELWHQDKSLQDIDCVMLPGGFSYGDYLRAGAIARFSPIMGSIGEFAAAGGLVIGICNGFQILCEAGLLPGALRKNSGLRYICRSVHVVAGTTNSALTRLTDRSQPLEIPVSHFEGSYFCNEDTLGRLCAGDQILLRYCNARGEITPESNPNGSVFSIAGVCSANRNVIGLMPHPERAVDEEVGSTQARVLFDSLEADLEISRTSAKAV